MASASSSVRLRSLLLSLPQELTERRLIASYLCLCTGRNLESGDYLSLLVGLGVIENSLARC
jgi:hypothetical protein